MIFTLHGTWHRWTSETGKLISSRVCALPSDCSVPKQSNATLKIYFDEQHICDFFKRKRQIEHRVVVTCSSSSFFVFLQVFYEGSPKSSWRFLDGGFGIFVGTTDKFILRISEFNKFRKSIVTDKFMEFWHWGGMYGSLYLQKWKVF